MISSIPIPSQTEEEDDVLVLMKKCNGPTLSALFSKIKSYMNKAINNNDTVMLNQLF